MSGCFDCECDKKPNLLQRLVFWFRAKWSQIRARKYLPSLIQRTKELDQIVENQRVKIARLEKFLLDNFEDFNLKSDPFIGSYIGTSGSSRPSNIFAKSTVLGNDSKSVSIVTKKVSSKSKVNKKTKKRSKGGILWEVDSSRIPE